MKKGTRFRAQLLDYVKEYRKTNGFPPSVGEMAAEFGTVKSNIYHHLQQLEKEGQMLHTPGKARSWVLI